MKKILSLLLVLALVMGMAACGQTGGNQSGGNAAPAEEDSNWKIAILTGTVSQGEEEFRAAEKAVAQYGEEHIVTATYPDNFMSEMETTVSQLVPSNRKTGESGVYDERHRLQHLGARIHHE